MPAIVHKSLPDDSAALDNAPAQAEELSLKRLLQVSTIVLQQALDLVDNTLTSDDQLTVHSQYMPGSTIGEAFPLHSVELC